jgi:ubiquinol-cytochrome c reductase cytochrome b subunit
MKKQHRIKEEPFNILNNSLVDLPTPSSISTLWNMGFILGIILTIQIITGIILSMHFINNSTISFESVIMITRNVRNGWALRFIHINGASLIFMIIFLHISRGLFFSSSYTKKTTWNSGLIILILSMATAFLGYVLPWGQMSFWGAAVITNIFSALPYIGKTVVQWLWGNFSVSQPTLSRFFSLHYVLPLIIILMVILHLIMLHSTGSSNPLGVKENVDKIKFSPSMINKDLTTIRLIFLALIVIRLNYPLVTGDVENFNQSNPLLTPIHIQPEWYFLFAYAILRSIPSKLGGAIALVASIAILSITGKTKNNKKFNPQKKIIIWTTVVVFIILTWVGINPVEPPFLIIGQITRTVYFPLMLIV